MISIFLKHPVSRWTGKIHICLTFLTNGIQALQHWSKKCMDHKGDYVKKINLICSRFMRLSRSAYELFGWPSLINILIRWAILCPHIKFLKHFHLSNSIREQNQFNLIQLKNTFQKLIFWEKLLGAEENGLYQSLFWYLQLEFDCISECFIFIKILFSNLVKYALDQRIFFYIWNYNKSLIYSKIINYNRSYWINKNYNTET